MGFCFGSVAQTGLEYTAMEVGSIGFGGFVPAGKGSRYVVYVVGAGGMGGRAANNGGASTFAQFRCGGGGGAGDVNAGVEILTNGTIYNFVAAGFTTNVSAPSGEFSAWYGPNTISAGGGGRGGSGFGSSATDGSDSSGGSGGGGGASRSSGGATINGFGGGGLFFGSSGSWASSSTSRGGGGGGRATGGSGRLGGSGVSILISSRGDFQGPICVGGNGGGNASTPLSGSTGGIGGGGGGARAGTNTVANTVTGGAGGEGLVMLILSPTLSPFINTVQPWTIKFLGFFCVDSYWYLWDNTVMDCLSFPVKFNHDGLARLAEGSYDYFKQILTISLLTEPGEHPITPDFGVYDPSFITVEPENFILNAARFVPEVEIRDIVPSQNQNGGLSVQFSFNLRG
jgi:hypothetical protein